MLLTNVAQVANASGEFQLRPNPGFGDRVREARNRLRNPNGSRWTHAQLAEAIGVERNAVSRWENQGKTPRDQDTYVELAKVLRVSLDWLITGHGSPSGIGYVREPTPYGQPPRARLAVSVKGERPRPTVYGRMLTFLEDMERRGYDPEKIAEAEGMLLDFMYSDLFPQTGRERSDAILLSYVEIIADAINRALALAEPQELPEGIKFAPGNALPLTPEIAKAADEAERQRKAKRRRPGKP